MKPILSIIMPCYNCSTTLTEALDSVYAQESPDFPFEIIMVDDKSADKTAEMLREFKKTRKNIRTFFHSKNKGGGAARNTGIKEAKGDYIFCMDGDDILPPNTLPQMIKHIQKTGVDGAVFHERRFFHGKNSKKYKQHFNTILDRSFRMDDIYNDSKTLINNFLYTRETFDLAQGYPEHHGFDTQCFETKVLASGCSISVCPQSIYYHRQAQKTQKSYYERVFESGKFSESYYLICEDVLHFFAPRIQKEIILYDIYDKSNGSENLKTFLDKEYQKDPKNFFRIPPKAHTSYEESGERYFNECKSKNSCSFEEKFFTGIQEYRKKNYTSALRIFEELLKKKEAPVLRLNYERIKAATKGVPFPEQIAEAHKTNTAIAYKKQADVFERPSELRKIARKVKAKISSFW